MTDATLLPQITVARAQSYPPRVSEFTQVFWDSLRQGRWQTTCCQDCGRQTFPPKPVCPHCWSPRVAWKPLAATGRLYSWTRIHAAPTAFTGETPYAVGIVDLADGLRLACRLAETEGVDLAVGQPVEMIVLQYEDGPLFAARPVRGVTPT